MQKIKYTIAIILTIMVTYSCDFLDNKPKGMTIPSNYEDYEKLLNQQSLGNSTSSSILNITDDVHLINREGATASDYVFENKSDDVKNLYRFKGGQLYVSGVKDYDWNSSYDRIFTLNTIINAVMGSKGSTEESKLRLKAEALFSRAFDYFNLVNLYGKHYDATTAATDFGIPYVTKADINQKYVRHTVQEVYDFIFQDLEEAGKSLAEIAPNNFDPIKSDMHSFYSRIYLFMGNFEKALESANKALEANSNLLNLNDYEYADGSTWGRVFLKGDKSVRLPDMESVEANYVKWGGTNLRGNTMLSEEMRTLFTKDLDNSSIDLRKEFYFSEDSVNMGRTDYFPGECAYVLYAYENVGFTSVENILIAAECEARIGSKDRAMTLINKLRDNRIENNIDVTAANNSDALNFILEERRRELVMKGSFRYFDLKRLNKEDQFKKSIVHTVEGVTYTLDPNDPKYIMPINQEILNFNPDMPQYER